MRLIEELFTQHRQKMSSHGTMALTIDGITVTWTIAMKIPKKSLSSHKNNLIRQS